MTELTKPDLVTKGMNLLPSFWDDKPKARGLLLSLLSAFQNPLDLIFEVLNGTSLFDAVGVQLDVIGKLWNIARQGDTDDNYRDRIFARITQQVADSTPEKVIEIIKVASNATEIKLFEHYPGNVHVGINVGMIESLKTLGEDIVGAGIDFNIRAEPIHDNVSGTRSTAFEYRSFNLLTGSWTDSNVTYTAATGTAPDGTTTLFTLQDADALNHGYRYQAIPSYDPSKKYHINTWISQDLAATHNALLRVTLTGGVTPEIFDLEIDPVTGQYLNNNDVPDKLRVANFNSIYFVWMEISTADLTQTTLTVELYPAISTTLGTYDVATTGTTEFWTPVVAEVNETQHNSAYETQGTLICSERIIEQYNLIDNVGDFIIDNVGDFIVVDTGIRYTGTGSQPLAEYCNSTKAQPCTEVF